MIRELLSTIDFEIRTFVQVSRLTSYRNHLKYMFKKWKKGFLILIFTKDNRVKVLRIKRYFMTIPLVILLRIIYHRSWKGYFVFNLDLLPKSYS